MSTTRQQESSRHNGALSIGPVTAEGKARSARNSTKHGLTGGPVVLPHESQHEYDAFCQSVEAIYRPANPVELDLVQEMAASRWRMRRLEFMETALLSAAYERHLEALEEGADPAIAIVRSYADVAENSKGLRLLERHGRSLRRAYEKALQELRLIQEISAQKAQQQAEQIEQAEQMETERHDGYSRGLAMAAGANAGGQVTGATDTQATLNANSYRRGEPGREAHAA